MSVESETTSQQWKLGVSLAIFGTFLFALKSIFIKLAFAEGATVELVLFLRMLMAAPFYLGMLVFLRKRGKVVDLKGGELLKMLSVGFLGYYLASYLDIAGLSLISAQLERLTLFTYPTMIAVLAWLFLGEKITRAIVLSLILCYAGLFVMYGEEASHGGGENIAKGVGLVLGSALSYSLYVILAKPMIQRYGSRLFTSIAMLGSTLFVGAHFFSLNSVNFTEIKPMIWVYCLVLAFVCTVIPSYMITGAVSKIGATRTTVLGSAGPIFTILLAVVIIGEPFTSSHLAGVILVLVGVACVTFKKKKKIT